MSKFKLWMGAILLVTLCIGDYYIDMRGASIYQKSLLLLVAIIFVLKFGFDSRRIYLLLAYSVAIWISFLAAEYSGGNPDLPLMIISFLSMSTGFIFYSARLPERIAVKLLFLIICLPIISVVSGFALIPIIDRLPWLIEFTGAFRFGGALIPAHLAMLCVVALMACCVYPFKSDGVRLALVMLILLLLMITGARAALLAAVIAIFPLINFLKRRAVIVSAITLIPIFSFVAYDLIDNVILRTFGSNTELINTSGRAVAWRYFVDMNVGSGLFGNGFGAVTLLTQNVFEENLNAFVVPHNEYIRFYYDIGVIGSTFFFLCFYGLLLLRSMSFRINRSYSIAFIISHATYSLFDNTFGTPQFIICFLLLFSVLDCFSRSCRLKEGVQNARGDGH